MYYSFPSVAQHSWSGIPSAPYIFSPSPTSSIHSRGPPQILLDPRNPPPTSFDEGRIRRSQEFYAPPRPSISVPPGRGDLWDTCNLSQLFSVNAGPPPPPSGGQPRSRQQQQQQQHQLLFGGTHSPLAFDIDTFWPTPPADENYIPSPITPASLPGPLPPLPPPPTDQMPFSQSVPAGDHLSLAWLNRLEPVSTPGGPIPQGGSQVAAAPPKRPRIQRSSSRPSKKRKDGRADGKDEPVRVLSYFSPTRLKFLPHEGSASVLPDGKAGEPGQTPEIRWAQAQRRTPSGQARVLLHLQHCVGATLFAAVLCIYMAYAGL
jgi:hypothetical protein